MAESNPRRKVHRLPAPSYRGAKCHFVTICCHHRNNFFVDDGLVRTLENAFNEACAAHCFNIYSYCFMPNHFHALLIGLNESADLLAAMRTFKGIAAARVRSVGITRLWQKGFYDHIVRGEESLNRVSWYILMNPVRAGFVDKASRWPFSHCALPGWKKELAPEDFYLPPWKQPTAKQSKSP